MAERKPQINFQVERSMKMLYEEAELGGHRATRLCAAGFLLMVEDPNARVRAVSRLRDWEAQNADVPRERLRSLIDASSAARSR